MRISEGSGFPSKYRKYEKHGMRWTAEYRVWVGIKSRCYHKSTKGFDRYGAKGVRICKRWLNSFMAFYKDMGPRPGPDYDLTRKNHDRAYSKANCEWKTHAQNMKELRCHAQNKS